MSIEQAAGFVVANIYFASSIDSKGFRWALGAVYLALTVFYGRGN